MKLTVVGKTYQVEKDLLEKVAKAAFSYLGITDLEGEIELKFVTEEEIRALNLAYRGYDQPTDVLSFNISETPLVGQIVICYTYTVRSAKKAGKSIQDEVALLVVHGILHVMGYDHRDETETREMQAIEREILALEGIEREGNSDHRSTRIG